MVMTYDVQMEIGHFHSTPRSAPALPCASRPPSAPRPWHARPTHQPSVSPAKQLPPMPGERGAWRGALPGPDRSLSAGTGRILTNGGFHSTFGGLSHPGSPLHYLHHIDSTPNSICKHPHSFQDINTARNVKIKSPHPFQY